MARPSHVVSCFSARASLNGRLMFASDASTRGGIPLVRRSSIGSRILLACSTTLDHARWYLVRWMVLASPVLLSLGTFLQVSVAQFPAKFLLSLPWLQILTSQMAWWKANKTRTVLHVSTTTTYGFDAKPRCVSNARSPTLQGTREAVLTLQEEPSAGQRLP